MDWDHQNENVSTNVQSHTYKSRPASFMNVGSLTQIHKNLNHLPLEMALPFPKA